MNKEEIMICAECRGGIKESYFTCLDNFIQAKYFDLDEDNIFCSQYCLNESMSIKELDKE